MHLGINNIRMIKNIFFIIWTGF